MDAHRQGTAYCVPECRVGRTFARCASSPAARHVGPVWPCVLVVCYSYRGRYSRAVTTPPLLTTLSVETLLRGTDEFSVEHWSSQGDTRMMHTQRNGTCHGANQPLDVDLRRWVCRRAPSEPGEPLGVGRDAVHGWHIGPDADHPVNRQVMSDMLDGMGATIMGRNMFGPVRGEWGDSDWRGWWGDNPPYHCPVFVLTHHEHDPIEMNGGTTFHFVTDGIESAYAQAEAAAGGKDISIAGGASCARQAITGRASSTRSTCRCRR